MISSLNNTTKWMLEEEYKYIYLHTVSKDYVHELIVTVGFV